MVQQAQEMLQEIKNNCNFAEYVSESNFALLGSYSCDLQHFAGGLDINLIVHCCWRLAMSHICQSVAVIEWFVTVYKTLMALQPLLITSFSAIWHHWARAAVTSSTSVDLSIVIAWTYQEPVLRLVSSLSSNCDVIDMMIKIFLWLPYCCDSYLHLWPIKWPMPGCCFAALRHWQTWRVHASVPIQPFNPVILLRL